MKPQQLAFLRIAGGQPEAVLDRDLVLPAGTRLRLAQFGGAVAAVVLVDLPDRPTAALPGPLAGQPTPPVSGGQPTHLPSPPAAARAAVEGDTNL